MKKIKRKWVEELYQARSDWRKTYQDAGYQETEEERNAYNVICEKRHVFENELSAAEVYAMCCFIISIIEEGEFAKLSLSRLIKCLEVCGIEVEE